MGLNISLLGRRGKESASFLVFDLFVVVEKTTTITAIVSTLVVEETTTTTSDSAGSQSGSRCGAGGSRRESACGCRRSFEHGERDERYSSSGVDKETTVVFLFTYWSSGLVPCEGDDNDTKDQCAKTFKTHVVEIASYVNVSKVLHWVCRLIVRRCIIYTIQCSFVCFASLFLLLNYRCVGIRGPMNLHKLRLGTRISQSKWFLDLCQPNCNMLISFCLVVEHNKTMTNQFFFRISCIVSYTS